MDERGLLTTIPMVRSNVFSAITDKLKSLHLFHPAIFSLMDGQLASEDYQI